MQANLAARRTKAAQRHAWAFEAADAIKDDAHRNALSRLGFQSLAKTPADRVVAKNVKRYIKAGLGAFDQFDMLSALVDWVEQGKQPEEIRQALAYLWRNAARLGLDRDRIALMGHSAGGHLTQMMLATDWPAYAPDLPADLVKAAVAGGMVPIFRDGLLKVEAGHTSLAEVLAVADVS